MRSLIARPRFWAAFFNRRPLGWPLSGKAKNNGRIGNGPFYGTDYRGFLKK